MSLILSCERKVSSKSVQHHSTESCPERRLRDKAEARHHFSCFSPLLLTVVDCVHFSPEVTDKTDADLLLFHGGLLLSVLLSVLYFLRTPTAKAMGNVKLLI